MRSQIFHILLMEENILGESNLFGRKMKRSSEEQMRTRDSHQANDKLQSHLLGWVSCSQLTEPSAEFP